MSSALGEVTVYRDIPHISLKSKSNGHGCLRVSLNNLFSVHEVGRGCKLISLE